LPESIEEHILDFYVKITLSGKAVLRADINVSLCAGDAKKLEFEPPLEGHLVLYNQQPCDSVFHCLCPKDEYGNFAMLDKPPIVHCNMTFFSDASENSLSICPIEIYYRTDLGEGERKYNGYVASPGQHITIPPNAQHAKLTLSSNNHNGLALPSAVELEIGDNPPS
jgi:hypothetical protein